MGRFLIDTPNLNPSGGKPTYTLTNKDSAVVTYSSGAKHLVSSY